MAAAYNSRLSPHIKTGEVKPEVGELGLASTSAAVLGSLGHVLGKSAAYLFIY